MEAKQITVQDNGQLFYQADATNPTPGVPVAKLVKGDHVLTPALEMLPAAVLTEEQAVEALKLHMDTVLAPLAGMRDLSDVPAPVATICEAVYEGAGIADRAAVVDAIGELDTEMRAAVRGKGVRLGPILLFCPDLNKPAAIRLRAVLYAVYHGMELPAPVVPDGMVSQAVEADEVLKGFYRAISYPVYGPRAIRIDMLDRVVNLVYELADKGQFQAQHQMAEWLGCGIADLYAVLEALGHKKVHDPLSSDDCSATSPADVVVEETIEAEAVEEKAEETPEEPKPDVKPELATFRLKKGKAYQSGGGAKPARKKRDDRKQGKKKPAGKKPRKDTGPRVITAEAAPAPEENSPWAALQQLKK